jgi:D-alanine transaminase
MYVQELPREPILEKRQRGIKTKFLPDLRHQFCRLKTTNLLANLLALTEAYQDGAEEALLVNGELQISEGSHTNFAMIHQGTLITPPLEQNILPGITRLHTLALARQLNIPIVEKPVTRDMILNEAAELMILGTTTEIMPVIQVDHHKINQGQPGPMTKKLIQAFDASIV